MSAAQTRLLSTNKVEAFHLRTLKVLPKSKTYSGSFEGRVHSAVHNGSVGQVKTYIADTGKMKTNHNMSQKKKKRERLQFLAKRTNYHPQVQRGATSKRTRYALKQRKVDLKQLSSQIVCLCISLTSGQLISELFPDCTRSCFSQVVLGHMGSDRIYEMRCPFVAV